MRTCSFFVLCWFSSTEPLSERRDVSNIRMCLMTIDIMWSQGASCSESKVLGGFVRFSEDFSPPTRFLSLEPPWELGVLELEELPLLVLGSPGSMETRRSGLLWDERERLEGSSELVWDWTLLTASLLFLHKESLHDAIKHFYNKGCT